MDGLHGRAQRGDDAARLIGVRGGPRARRDDGGADQRGVVGQADGPHVQARQAHLHEVVVREAHDGVDVALREGGLLRVPDGRDGDVGQGQARPLQGGEGRVPVGPVLSGDPDGGALEVGQGLDGRVVAHDDRARVVAVVAPDGHEVHALRGGDGRLVARGDDHVLLTREQRGEQALVGAVVAHGGVHAVVGEDPLGDRHVGGGELHVRDVGEAHHDRCGPVVPARGGGCLLRSAGAQPEGRGRQGGGGAQDA